MVRTFLKHAEEIQDDESFLEVPRTIFDYCRAVEPARERGDTATYLHRIRSKLSKLRRAASPMRGARQGPVYNTRLNQSTEHKAEITSRTAPTATNMAVTSTLRERAMTMRVLSCW